jgi:hypothetical protein
VSRHASKGTSSLHCSRRMGVAPNSVRRRGYWSEGGALSPMLSQKLSVGLLKSLNL